jgi:hypothetical protein
MGYKNGDIVKLICLPTFEINVFVLKIIRMAQDEYLWQALVNTVMNLSVQFLD